MRTAPAPDQLLYTPEDAGRVLGLGRSKVFELLADGQLSSVQIGRSRRIPRTALESFVAGLQAQVRTAA